MKTQIATRRWRPLRRTAVFALAGLAGLLGLLVVLTALCERSQTKARVAASAAAVPSAATARRPQDFWDLRVDRWRADARTVVAAIRYLLDPDPQIVPSRHSQYSELALPTNSTSVVPKA